MPQISKKKIDMLLLIIIPALIIAVIFTVKSYFANKPSTPQPQTAQAHVIFLNVGQGDAILIQKDRRQILIDGGNGRDILNRLGETMPLFDKSIDLVVATHPDEDHMGGLVKVLENYQIGEIMETGIACEKDMCKKMDELISQKHIPVLNAVAGDEIKIANDIDMFVLYPFENIAGKEFKETNDSSIVMKADIAGKKYLFTGDAQDKTEKALMAANFNLHAGLLKVGHHGSKHSTSAAFLQEVMPEEAVISVGENKYGHPTQEVLTRLQNMNIKILRTDQAGSIRF